MTKVLGHLQSNVIAYVALFVALGGTGYAAVNIPKGSVGTSQLKNHSVTPIKLDRGSIAGYVRDYAQIDASGRLVAARPKAHLITWRTTGPALGGDIEWNKPIPASCFALATTEGGPDASYASAEVGSGGPRHDGEVSVAASPDVDLSDQGVGPVNVAVICPE